jgi:hypothetical protein
VLQHLQEDHCRMLVPQGEKKISRPVSRVLCHGGLPSFIWDSRHRLPLAAYPFRFPGRSREPGRATLCFRRTGRPGIYMASQLMGWTALHVTMQTGELLPHLFTLTPEGAVIFSSTCHTLTDIFPLGSMMPCAARTFLLPQGGRRWNGLLSYYVPICFHKIYAIDLLPGPRPGCLHHRFAPVIPALGFPSRFTLK